MSSAFPGGLDSFSTTRTTGQVVQASTDNDHSDAINKIEAELGTDPSGSSSTVAARVLSAETSIGFHVGRYLVFADPIQEAINACSAAGGGKVTVNEGVWSRSAAAAVAANVYVEGHGPKTIVRCTGNHYAFALQGALCGVRNLKIDAGATGAGSAQTSGGAIDYTDAGDNTDVDRIQLGSYLKTCFNVTPDTVTAVHRIRNIRINGELSIGTVFKFGDGTNLMTDITLGQVDVTGSASNGSDIARFMEVARNVDTLTFDGKILCIKALEGIRLGNVGSSGAVTGMAADFLVLDQIPGRAIDAQNTLDVVFGEKCQIQTCGSSTNAGVYFGAGAVATVYDGTIRNCAGDGAFIANGSIACGVGHASRIYDNNTGNTANLSGVRVEANASRFFILSRVIGNFLGLSTGHQKYGWRIESGTSSQLAIDVRVLWRNETAPFSDGAAGGIKDIRSAVAVDSAGTTVVGVDTEQIGRLYVKDTAAAERVRLDNSGFVNVVGQFAANYLLDLNAPTGQTANLARFRVNSVLKSAINSGGAFVSDVATQGIVLKDTAGTPHYWRVNVSAAGALSTTDLGTTRPD